MRVYENKFIKAEIFEDGFGCGGGLTGRLLKCITIFMMSVLLIFSQKWNDKYVPPIARYFYNFIFSAWIKREKTILKKNIFGQIWLVVEKYIELCWCGLICLFSTSMSICLTILNVTFIFDCKKESNWGPCIFHIIERNLAHG